MTWITNSLVDLANNTAYNTEASYLLVAVAGFILIHSWYLHRLTWNRVRIISDCVCLCSIGTGIGVAYANTYPTQYNIAFGVDLFTYGFFSTTISVLDLVITYSRYKLLSLPLCAHQDLLVALYIFLLVVLPGLPFYTIVPFFASENEGPGMDALNICLYYVIAPAISFFNFFFAGVFYAKIVCWKFGGKLEQHPKMLLLAYKSGIHALTSTGASVYMAASSLINPVQGQLCCCFIIAGSIHFLFNWKFEYLGFYKSIMKEIASSDDKKGLYPYELDYEQVIVKNDGIEMTIDTGLRAGRAGDIEVCNKPVPSQLQSPPSPVQGDPDSIDPLFVAKRMGFI